MKSCKYILIILLVSLAGNVYLLFWPSDQVSNLEHERIKIRLSEVQKDRKRYQDLIQDKIILDSLEFKRISENQDKDETLKSQSNEKAGIDVAVIRNVGVDTLISTDETWPEGY